MKRLLILLALSAATVCATPIHWFSTLNHFNLASDDQPMSAAYRFELGVFRDGFVPTPENRAEWSTYWAPAQRVRYNATYGWYSGYFVVENNEAPFTAGADAWVWGFSGDASGGDWLLFRNPSWKWPKADTRNPVARQWTAKTAIQVASGEVRATGPRLLKGAPVENLVPPPTQFDQWLEETGEDADADSLLRFATGKSKGPVRLERIAQSGGSDRVKVRVPHLADRPLRRVDLEISEDLVSWHPYNRYARLTENAPTEIIFELEDWAGEIPQLFFRSRYEP